MGAKQEVKQEVVPKELNYVGKLNASLYYLDQTALQLYIKKFLRAKNIPFIAYKGNIFSMRHPEKPLFVAHMDTVGEKDVGIQLVVVAGWQLTRRTPAILGADDKAGVNVMLNHIEDINFCFTRDEETGGKGARDLFKFKPFLDMLTDKKIPCAIQFDRRSGSDIIDYCEKDLLAEIKKVLPHYKTAFGTFTDVKVWKSVLPAVNLSVGYYSAHSSNEYLNIEEYLIANDSVPELNKIRGTFKIQPVPVYKKPTYTKYYEKYTCTTCGAKSNGYFPKIFKDKWNDDTFYCVDCLVEMFGIEAV